MQCVEALVCLKFIIHNKIMCRIQNFGTWKQDCVIKTREIFSFLPLISNSVTIVVTWTSDMVPVLSKEFLDTQEITESRFTLKRVGDMIRTHSQFKLCFFLFSVVTSS